MPNITKTLQNARTLTYSLASAHLVVVPGDQLHECGAQLDASLGVHSGGGGVADEVTGYNILLSVAAGTYTKQVLNDPSDNSSSQLTV